MRPKFVIGGLASEAWGRCLASYSRAMESYQVRVRDGLQPSTPLINLFDVKHQHAVLVVTNLMYLLITMFLFMVMKKRIKGLKLRWYLVIYDAMNVLLAGYICLSTLRYKLGHGGLLLCNPVATDPEGYRIAKVFVLFYLQKYMEFIDTWFFILRKSSRQVTFLHLFHHSSITIVVGCILPFDFNGDMYLPIMLNSANHMLVYLHYLLATLGLQSWWAPYITSMQLAQFCIIFAQSLLSYRVGPTCGSPDFAKVLMIIYMGSLIALFGNFFLQKYIFQRPHATLDMCGVIKRPQVQPSLACQHCGTLLLDNRGSAMVLLPSDFPDPAPSPQMSALAGLTYTNPPFSIAYHLTPIGGPMPNVHVSKEVARFKGPIVGDERLMYESADKLSEGMRSKASLEAMALRSRNSMQSSQRETNTNANSKLDGKAGSKKAAVSQENNSKVMGRSSDGSSSNGAAKAKKGDKSTAKKDFTLPKLSSKSSPSLYEDGVIIGRPFAVQNGSDSEKVTDAPANGLRLSPELFDSASIRTAKEIMSSGPGAIGGMPRARSDGHLPGAIHTGNRLHNDRLIDGPLPSVLSGNGIMKFVDKGMRGLSGNTSPDASSVDLGYTLEGYDIDDNNPEQEYPSSSDEDEPLGEILEALSPANLTSAPSSPTKSAKSPKSSFTESRGADGQAQGSGKKGWGLGIRRLRSRLRRPLYFAISGGKPGGQVSWMVQTIPITISPQEEERLANLKSLQDDWRAIS